jgi:hypothetical protein
MAGLVPAIHAFLRQVYSSAAAFPPTVNNNKTWMAGTSPAMTNVGRVPPAQAPTGPHAIGTCAAVPPAVIAA